MRQIDLLEKGKHSDFTIIAGDSKVPLPVHKSILSAHSPVFDAMLSHNETEEVQTSQVKIPDVSVKVLKDFLMYIYTGVFPSVDRISVELLAVADKVHYNLLKKI